MSAGAADPAGPVFTVGGAARRLGIPAGTLRTWERRHGIGPSGRSAGGHRRYTHTDLLRLRAMRALAESGVPPAQAASLATLATPGSAAPRGSPDHSASSVAMLLRAADALDAPLLVLALSDAFARHGVAAGWQQLAVPALRELGARAPHAAGHGAAEHMLSGCLLATLQQVIMLAPPPRSVRPVVLACAEEEQHVLPLYALHAELAGRGVDIRQLGSRVPRQALAHAVRAIEPAAVFVWAQMPGTANPALLAGLTPEGRIVAGGPGWPRRPGQLRARLVDSLGDAADLLTQYAFSPP